MRNCRQLAVIIFLTVSWVFPLWSGYSGKIAGTITEKTTAKYFQDVRVAAERLSVSTFSDARRRYVIMAVPPGKYAVKFSFPEYNDILVPDVQVDIDQTSWVNFAMELLLSTNNTIEMSAEKNIIRPNVTTSSVTLSNEQIRDLPINNLVSAIGLHSGIRGGWNSAPGSDRSLNQGFGENYASGKVSVQGDLTIRGGEGDNILFMVDGITMRDPRNNEPLAKIPLSPVEEISVVPNGFNAEYGQVQSSIVHVITREGGKQGYSGIFKYTMPRLPPNTGTDAVYVISRVHTLICCVPFLIPRLNKYEENHHVPLYYINPNLIFSSNYYLPCSGSC
jgi:hypothetical protein